MDTKKTRQTPPRRRTENGSAATQKPARRVPRDAEARAKRAAPAVAGGLLRQNRTSSQPLPVKLARAHRHSLRRR